jgi:glycosyltransferase involved in cell wall biosynthesis
MKIIAIDARESGTSTGRYIDKLIEYLHVLKPEFDIYILAKPHRLDYFKELAPNFTVVKSAYKEFTFAEQLGFCVQLMRLRVNLVHFSMVQQPVLYPGKVVTTMHDLTTVRFKNPNKNPVVFAIKQQIYKWVNERVAHKSAAIITPSEFVKDDVARFARINSRKVVVTYEAADAITDPPEPIKNLVNKKFIMYVGRPTPHKNLERLIDAFSALRGQHPNLYLVLAGKMDDNYRRIEKDAQQRNLKKVVFTDFVSEGQLRWLYEHCQAYVFPSLSEGFGLPGLEAMAHGAVVVSSNATCLPEIYGQAAHYFDPLDVQAMSDAINEVLTNKSLRDRLSRAGISQVQKYSWQRMAEQTYDIYRQILLDN